MTGAAAAGLIFGLQAAAEAQVFLRGDTNADGKATIADAHYTLSYLFRGIAQPQCMRAADLNGNQQIDISDSIFLLNHLFLGGPVPCEPFPEPGPSPFAEELPCDAYVIGPPLEDAAAEMEVSNAIAGPDGHATINLLVSSSRDLAGYAAVLGLEGAAFGSVVRASDLSGTLAGGFVSAKAFGGRIHIGFLSTLTGNKLIPAGVRQPVFQLEVCLEPGIAAGDVEMKLESAELVDFDSGRSIIPRVVKDILAVPVDLGQTGCNSPPAPTPERKCNLAELLDPPIPRGGPTLDFARGDVNLDGRVSISDALWMRRLILDGGPIPPCADAADATDDGRVNGADTAFILRHLYQGGPPPPPPFLAAGPDPTPDEFGCASDRITPPPPAAEDALRLGESEGVSGGFVDIPVFLTSTAPVGAIQLLIRFDPAVFQPDGPRNILRLEGGFFETEPPVTFVSMQPLEANDVFTLAVIPDRQGDHFDVPPGQDRLLFFIRGTIAPGLGTGATTEVTLSDGPGGEGFGAMKMRNELSSLGRTILPRLDSGIVRIVEGKPILRGDGNHDGRVDISDGIFILNHLFLGGPLPRCADEADANDDGQLSLSDAINILNTLFLGGSGIRPPFPEPGPDPTPDEFSECPSLGP